PATSPRTPAALPAAPPTRPEPMPVPTCSGVIVGSDFTAPFAVSIGWRITSPTRLASALPAWIGCWTTFATPSAPCLMPPGIAPTMLITSSTGPCSLASAALLAAPMGSCTAPFGKFGFGGAADSCSARRRNSNSSVSLRLGTFPLLVAAFLLGIGVGLMRRRSGCGGRRRTTWQWHGNSLLRHHLFRFLHLVN